MWVLSKASRERWVWTLISSFSTSRDIVVVYLQLFMEKQEASSLAPSFLCCADSVVRGMFVIRSKLLPNKGLNWNHIGACVWLLKNRCFSRAN